MEKIKVILWGLGTMGTLMAKIIAEKRASKLRAVDRDPGKIGRALGEVTGRGSGKIKILATGRSSGRGAMQYSWRPPLL